MAAEESKTSLERLGVVHFVTEPTPEPQQQLFSRQVLVRVLQPIRFDFGVTQRRLSTFTYQKDEVILCERGREEWVRWSNPASMLLVAIPDIFLQMAADELNLQSFQIVGEPHFSDPRVSALLQGILADRSQVQAGGRLFDDAISLALATSLLRSTNAHRTPPKGYADGLSPAQFRRVQEFVRDHLGEDLSLKELASVADLSPSYFAQRFSRTAGLTPHAFLVKERIKRSRELLAEGKLRILDVAITCGFSSQQHFARVFKSHLGLSPTEFGKRIRMFNPGRS